MISIIKYFSKPIRRHFDGHSSEELPIITLFNALTGYNQKTGT
ncbi:MAG: hypothetical protein ACTSRP_17800 [Candidatus Helarchaeota archaeon]